MMSDMSDQMIMNESEGMTTIGCRSTAVLAVAVTLLIAAAVLLPILL